MRNFACKFHTEVDNLHYNEPLSLWEMEKLGNLGFWDFVYHVYHRGEPEPPPQAKSHPTDCPPFPPTVSGSPSPPMTRNRRRRRKNGPAAAPRRRPKKLQQLPQRRLNKLQQLPQRRPKKLQQLPLKRPKILQLPRRLLCCHPALVGGGGRGGLSPSHMAWRPSRSSLLARRLFQSLHQSGSPQSPLQSGSPQSPLQSSLQSGSPKSPLQSPL